MTHCDAYSHMTPYARALPFYMGKCVTCVTCVTRVTVSDPPVSRRPECFDPHRARLGRDLGMSIRSPIRTPHPLRPLSAIPRPAPASPTDSPSTLARYPLPAPDIPTSGLLSQSDKEPLMTHVLGIDPRAHGAIAILDDSGDLIEIHDMPSIEETAGRPATNAPLLAAVLAKTGARIAFCEFVAARPTDSKTGAFSFGRARGVVEGVEGALDLRLVFITPPVWKRLANIPPGVESKDIAHLRGDEPRRDARRPQVGDRRRANRRRC